MSLFRTSSRRTFLQALAGTAAGAGASGALARTSPPISSWGRDAMQFGVRPGGTDDQTKALQRGIDACAQDRVPLALPPGTYRVSTLSLPDGAQIVGVRGATRLVLAGGPSLVTANHGGSADLTGIMLDGDDVPLPERRGLIHVEGVRRFRMTDCDIVRSGRTGIWMEKTGGDIASCEFADIAATAIVSFDAVGLMLARNTIRRAGDNGIEVLRHERGDDSTLVIDNRIETIANRSGGSGQYGNAINVFRGANVIVRGNRIRDCAYSAVRGNSASNIQIVGNTVTNTREVALYSEFTFEGAVIANNLVEGAATGISIANFNEGGRLASVTGNIIRNLYAKSPAGTPPDNDAGIGIYVEADTAVTGNVVENAPGFGIIAGWGRYLRNVAITGNVVRKAFIGIGVSVMPDAGTATVAGNTLSECPRGAVVGLDHAKPVTPDLTMPGAAKFPQVAVGMNSVH
jgi:uncharacterized secreted repeat protein (TIGR03808 family)